jgi:hypothetical protein
MNDWMRHELLLPNQFRRPVTGLSFKETSLRPSKSTRARNLHPRDRRESLRNHVREQVDPVIGRVGDE